EGKKAEKTTEKEEGGRADKEAKGEAPAAPAAPAAPTKAASAEKKAEDRPADTAAPLVGKAPAARPQRRPAGVLTAGSFDDNLNPRFFRTLAGKATGHPTLGELARKFE